MKLTDRMTAIFLGFCFYVVLCFAIPTLMGYSVHPLQPATYLFPHAPPITKEQINDVLTITPTDEWTLLEGCELLHSAHNDGDSFKFEHENQVYTARLYFVDCPETSNAFPPHLSEQSDYMFMRLDRHVSESEVIAFGKLAATQLPQILGNSKFNVYTQFEYGAGRSKPPRIYAMILLPESNRWLCETWTYNGLALIRGRTPDYMPDGTETKDFLHSLVSLEQSAAKGSRGYWQLK